MSDNDAMKKLLYAVLKQKCLKDVDWNKVAADPVLTTNGQPDVTNGHAARMRYSRFKKQMEGGNAPKARTRATPSAPKKPREKTGVVKKESPNKRIKTEDGRKNSAGSGSGVKSERAELSEGKGIGALSFASVSASATESFTTDAQSQGGTSAVVERRRPSALYPERAEDEIRIKHEPGHRISNAHNNPASYIRANSVLMMPTPNPSTPGYSASPSPCDQGSQNHSFQTGMGELGLMGGFGMDGFGQGTAEYLHGAGQSFGGEAYGAAMGENVGEYGSLLGAMGIGGEGFGMWNAEMSGVGGIVDENENRNLEERTGDVLVKTEERWDDAYRRGQ